MPALRLLLPLPLLLLRWLALLLLARNRSSKRFSTKLLCVPVALGLLLEQTLGHALLLARLSRLPDLLCRCIYGCQVGAAVLRRG
jgi:hypothetical protein